MPESGQLLQKLLSDRPSVLNLTATNWKWHEDLKTHMHTLLHACVHTCLTFCSLPIPCSVGYWMYYYIVYYIYILNYNKNKSVWVPCIQNIPTLLILWCFSFFSDWLGTEGWYPDSYHAVTPVVHFCINLCVINLHIFPIGINGSGLPLSLWFLSCFQLLPTFWLFIKINNLSSFFFRRPKFRLHNPRRALWITLSDSRCWHCRWGWAVMPTGN